LELQQAAPSSP